MPLEPQVGDTVVRKGPESKATWKVIGLNPDTHQAACSGPGPCRSVRWFNIEDLIIVSG